jgi:lysophospholipase L1-like esterase
MVLLTDDALSHAFQETDRILTEVSEKKGIELVDVSRSVSGRDEMFLDTVHLTDEGAEIVSGIVAKSLAELLSKRSEPSLLPSRRQAPYGSHS